MARIVPRGPRKDGGMSYQVKWRIGGGRDGEDVDPASETFKSPGCATKAAQTKADLKAESDAKRFRAAVEGAGEQWPVGFVPGMGSAGWNEQAYAAMVAAREAAPAEPAVAEVTTFADFAYKWVDHLTGVQPRTRADYRRDITLHMIPTFGHHDIADEDALDEYAISAWILAMRAGERDPDDPDTWLRKPKAVKTVANIHATLYVIFKAAVRAKLRATNPCEETSLPVGEDEDDIEEMVFLTYPEIHLLLAAANPDVRDLITVLVNTGLRWSELTALQVRDLVGLDGKNPHLRIRRAWKRQPDSTFKLGPPKTKQSRRSVSLAPFLVEIFTRLAAGRGDTDFLFITATRGVVWGQHQFFGTRWQPAVYRAVRCEAHRDKDGLKGVNKYGLRKEHLVPCGCPGTLTKVPRIHDMRHTHVAHLIAAREPMLAIQKRLGHKSAQTTSDRYGHLLPQVDEELVINQQAGWIGSLPGPNEDEPTEAG
jgi:integrase